MLLSVGKAIGHKLNSKRRFTMIDFNASGLNKTAQKKLQNVDRIIIHFSKYGGGGNAITLSNKDWQAINKAVKSATKDKCSLLTHSYNGYSLVAQVNSQN